MSGMLPLARAVARRIVDFALPPRCPRCGGITPDQHSFCVACWQGLSFIGDPCCVRCGLPFEYDGGVAECGACLAEPPPFERLRAAVSYGEIARNVALKLKYGGRPGVALTMARLMQRHVRPEDEGAILVPVPLHRWRIWRRGYNQSALIASALGRRTGLATDLGLIRRVKATPPLKGMGRRQRALTVRGAFAIDPAGKARVRGRSFLLVDDVYTSGATAAGCAKLLKRAGAESVGVLCWAWVVGGKD